MLDRGSVVLQFNTKHSSGKEKFNAAEFARTLVDGRQGHCELTVYDEGGQGAGKFLSCFDAQSMPSRETHAVSSETPAVSLLRLSDSSGTLSFEPISPPSRSSLSSSDAFLVDASSHRTAPAIYVWIGKDASLNERRLSLQYAQRYLYEKQEKGEQVSPAISIVRVKEGVESEAFAHTFAE